MSLTRKQVIFDLDTNQLKIYFPKENWRYAYEMIKNHMQKNNFKWQQGSSYVSKVPMSSEFVNQIIRKFVEDNPWINVCMRDCKQSNIGREYNQNFLFDKNALIPTREELRNQQEMESLEKAIDEYLEFYHQEEQSEYDYER